MHIDSGYRLKTTVQPQEEITPRLVSDYKARLAYYDVLLAIFERTYGKIKRPEREALHTRKENTQPVKHKPLNLPKGPGYLLVDGYNIIFAWDELNKMAADNLDLARNTLINILCNYQGFKQCEVILVFDAYRVPGNFREIEKVHNITVIYTKEAETADMFIEKTAHDLAKDYRVRVATSDGAVQTIILGSSAYRVSAEEFHKEVKDVEKAIREYF
jgi:predicted RNA-binding protein with PIN domain